VVFPAFAPDVTAQTDAVTGSLTLMILAAAPDPPVTLPVTATREVPVGHFRRVACSLKVMSMTVLPLPFFHVYVPFRVPAWVPFGGVVKAEVAPAASAVGVQLEIVPCDVPDDFGELSFAHDKCCGRAADTGVASVNVNAIAAAAQAIPPNRTECFMGSPSGQSSVARTLRRHAPGQGANLPRLAARQFPCPRAGLPRLDTRMTA
jgi:hypothetical protein